MRRGLMILVALLGCTDDECIVPAGTWRMSYEAMAGNCPMELVREVESNQRELDVLELECRPAGDTRTAEANGCTVAATWAWYWGPEGPERGRHRVDVDCSDGSSCSHEFRLIFEER